MYHKQLARKDLAASPVPGGTSSPRSDSGKEEPDTLCLERPLSDNFADWFKYLTKVEKIAKLKIKNAQSFEDSQVIMQFSELLLSCDKEMFELSPSQYIKFEVDRRVWNAALYDFITALRKRAAKASPTEREKKDNVKGTELLKIIDMGCAHYKSLLDDVQKVFSINFKQVFEKSGYLRQADQNKTAAIDLIYKILIYIGDLNRYGWTKANVHQAFEYYELARLCDVSKGRAFNQLGVLTFQMNDLFGAAYNFTRAHYAETPVDGARHQILEVHDQAVKKHLKDQKMYWYFLSKHKENTVKRDRRYRRETWIVPSFDKNNESKIPPVGPTPPNKKQHITSLSQAEIYYRFSLTYVLLWEKLYTKIGMDQFEEVAEESLVYFEGLLNRNVKISFPRIIQVVGFGLFNADKIAPAGYMDKCQLSQVKYNKEMATHFILEMFSIAVERLTKLIHLMDWNNPQVEYLSAAIRLWSEWLERNPAVWTKRHYRPKFSIRRVEKSRYLNASDRVDDVWVVFGQLLTQLELVLLRANQYVFPSVSLTENEGYTLLKTLPESIVLAGLKSVTESQFFKTQYYTKINSSHCRAQLYIRLKDIHRFGTEIVTNSIGYLSRKPSSFKLFEYVSIVKLRLPRDENKSCGTDERNFLYWADREHLNKDSTASKKNKVVRPDCNNSRIIVRKTKKTPVVLTKPVVDYSEAHNIWCTMHNHGYRSDMIVNPIRIVIDTNCFINKFEYVQYLVRLSPYPIILPVTVVLELKGLSKGGLRLRHREMYGKLDTEKAQGKLQEGNEVAEKCKIALEYINSHLQCFKVTTTTGRVISVKSISQRISDDFFDPTQRNDNRILDTCMYIEMTDKRLRARDTPIRLMRNTILITGDRGLRVKTLICDIPARDITITSKLYYLLRLLRA